MVREKDLCWEYCEKLDGNKVRCNFCQKILNGGISRLKHHLSRLPGKGVNPCTNVRDDISIRVRSIVQFKEQEKEAVIAKRQRHTEATAISPSHHSSLAIAGTAQASPAIDLGRNIALFFFENCLDFHVANSASYRQMTAAFGGGPSATALKTMWLEKLKSEVNSKIKEAEGEWATTGCTIIANTWTDRKSRTWIKFFISSPSGTFFHKSVDASPNFKNSKHVSELFDSVILTVGPENVVQIVVDNAARYSAIGGHIMQKYGWIFWSPCASRCLSLILEDFIKVEWVSRCIQQAQVVTRFIYNNGWLLGLMRKFTGGEEIVKSSFSKSISSFLSLQCMLKLRSRLKQMVNSQEYASSPFTSRCMEVIDDGQFWRAAEEAAVVTAPLLKVLRKVSGCKPATGVIYEYMTKAKEAIRTYYIMDEVKCKVFLGIVDERWRQHLHSPLHAAAAYLNPSLQYNPEAAKFLGSIKEEFHAVLDKLLPTTDLRQDITTQIFRFRKAQGLFGSNLAREARSTASPGMWWEQYGDSAPGLQHVAIRVLSQVCSANVLDCGSCGSHPVHPEKRNKLERETFNDLLYVHYNLNVQDRTKTMEGDPLVLKDMDMGSEWVEDAEPGNTSQWLDRFSSALDGGDPNSRQFTGSIFGSNDHLFNL